MPLLLTAGDRVPGERLALRVVSCVVLAREQCGDLFCKEAFSFVYVSRMY